MQPLSTDAVAKLHQNFQTKVQQLAAEAAGERTDLVAPLADYTNSFVAAFNASRGRWPKVEELQRLAEKGVEGIQAAAAELPANLTTDLFKGHVALPSSHYNHHAEVFGDADRLYFELESPEADKVKGIPKNIQNWLTEQGYQITDPEKGLVSNDGKNHTRIGRLLQKNGQIDMLESYTRSRSKSANNGLMMVVSRKPEDIARSSSARAWTSCMSEFGCNKRYVEQDIKHGSLVAYLVNKNDPDITNPVARRLIKPYLNAQGEMIMMPDNGYGISNGEFKRSAYDFCAKHFNKGKTGEYRLKIGLYPDGITGFRLGKDSGFHLISSRDDGNEMRNLPPHLCHGDCTAEDLLDYLGYQYSRGDNGEIIIQGTENVDLSYLPLTALPDMGHVVCEGFDCSNTFITDLQGTPRQVSVFSCCNNPYLTTLEDGPREARKYHCTNTAITSLKGTPRQLLYFDCGNNPYLTSLEGGPQEVQNYGCYSTLITSLKGVPSEVNSLNCCNNPYLTSLEEGPHKASMYYCQNTAITSLKGVPRHLHTFDCSNNSGIKNLEDGPQEVSASYVCSQTAITSLKGAPQNVLFFCCSENFYLTSLEHGPQRVEQYICSATSITSLAGAPQEVTLFDCSNNPHLTSLENGPQKAEEYQCERTSITSLAGAPQKVRTFNCSNNPHLSSLEGRPEAQSFIYKNASIKSDYER